MSHEFNNHAFTDCVLSHKVNMKVGLSTVIGLFQLCAPSFGGKNEKKTSVEVSLPTSESGRAGRKWYGKVFVIIPYNLQVGGLGFWMR